MPWMTSTQNGILQSKLRKTVRQALCWCLSQQMRDLDIVRQQLKAQPDGQISRIDPDGRSKATNAKGLGMAAYNVLNRPRAIQCVDDQL